MNFVLDTYVLLRAAINDDAAQAGRARQIMEDADRIVVPTIVICEFVWAARRVYKKSRDEVAHSIRLLIAADKVMSDRSAIDAGLAMLDAGGDFADGVIAYEGRKLGGETFVTFGKKASALLSNTGQDCRLLDSE